MAPRACLPALPHRHAASKRGTLPLGAQGREGGWAQRKGGRRGFRQHQLPPPSSLENRDAQVTLDEQLFFICKQQPPF